MFLMSFYIRKPINKLFVLCINFIKILKLLKVFTYFLWVRKCIRYYLDSLYSWYAARFSTE